MIYLFVLQALSVFFVQAVTQGPPFLRRNLMASPIPLSCKPSCEVLLATKDTPDVVCSCSSGCLTYGDCCPDAPFKNNGMEGNNLGCLTLFGLGPVSVVNRCPTSLGLQSDACTKDLKASVPVTSKDTGTSYSNQLCASCNNDGSNLVEWPVKLGCCGQDNIRVVYDDTGNSLQAVSEDGSKVNCECKFYPLNDDLSFANSLELRQCIRREISSCSVLWNVEDTRKMCNAYLDPVYIENIPYRNRHCATCNFQNTHGLKCARDVLDPLLISRDRLLALCKARGNSNCVSILRGTGSSASFSHLFSSPEETCVPPAGRKCCAGKRYDRHLKKCREIPTNVVL